MKTHLISSDDPLDRGIDMQAPCGAIVPKVEFRFMFEDSMATGKDLLDAMVSSFQVCRKCAELPLDKNYIYGMIGGQDSIDD